MCFFFFSSRRRHTRCSRDWSSDVCSSDLGDPNGTAAGALEPALAADRARVKVVVDPRGRAVYFSRAPIPFDRDGTGSVLYRQHVGVYAYTREALERWVRLPAVPEERWERLEQVRPLLHRLPVGLAACSGTPAPRRGSSEGIPYSRAAIGPPPQEVGTGRSRQ